MDIHWHRRDLRAPDNRGLAAAAADGGPVLPVFVLDETVLTHAGRPRVAFLLDALAALREWYRARGSDLLVAHGDPSAVVPALAREYGADRVTWNDDYSGLARRRDAAVHDALSAADVAVDRYHDALLFEPGSIRTNAGDPYQVFTYFARKWHDRDADAPIDPPEAGTLADVSGDPLPTQAELDWDAPAARIPNAGTGPARERLADFLGADVYRYEDRRDYPADRGTSRLSADLSFGTIGIREVYAATVEAMAGASDEADQAGVEEFQDQLAWREFYTQVLRYTPSLVAENFKSFPNTIEWRTDPEGLAAWKRGETGYPIVDAGMRQLREEAFMHNRVRMIVASFLTKDLLIDWREGLDWFRKRLVDHDPANDAGGWQWAASTGTDAQPYFRVFNPMTQGERYDPDAEYIARFVPELADVPAEVVHDWAECSQATRDEHAPDYPAPIVDHADRREQAIAMFERARGEE
jgi:deoxyribodipyrimidine photo-lyase